VNYINFAIFDQNGYIESETMPEEQANSG